MCEAIGTTLRLLLERYYFVPKISIQRNPRLRLEASSSAENGQAFDHSLWNGILQRHVRAPGPVPGTEVVSSTVDYGGIAADEDFDRYLKLLAAVDFATLAPSHQLALLINAYNALCIGLVVAHERQGGSPLGSLLALGGKARSVWNLPAGTIGGRPVTLNELEHAWLRGTWAEPRVHFAIVCASASCPDLRASAYDGDPKRLEAQLDEQAALFVSNATKGVRVELAGRRTATLSRILWWFADDFGGASRALAFAAEQLPATHAEAKATLASLAAKKGSTVVVPARYFDYYWTLNRAAC